MKDTIIITASVIGGIFGIIALILGSFMAVDHFFGCSKWADKYMLEINNGPDKELGFDYERAKELARGGKMYVMNACSEFK